MSAESFEDYCGSRFLQHFNMLVDARRRKLVDRQTSVILTGLQAAVNQTTPQFAEPPA